MANNTVNAQFYDVPAELSSYGQSIYQGARSLFNGRSFSSYCGTYVRCQLKAMGILENQFDLRGNGNQWYSNFENIERTSGGYYVYRESGSDCLEKLTEKYGNNLKNVVLSFPVQAGYSARYPGAGHAFILYELRDGIAYYSESFSFGGFREGEVIAEDIQSLLERYQRRHGTIIGCVMLSEEALGEDQIGENDAMFIAMIKEQLEALSDISLIAEKFTDMTQSRVMA